mgnify:CR=1 FL=1
MRYKGKEVCLRMLNLLSYGFIRPLTFVCAEESSPSLTSFAIRRYPDDGGPRVSCQLRNRPVSAFLRLIGAYEGLRFGKEAQDLGHQTLSLIRRENELRMGGAFEDHQFFRVGGFLILLANSGEPQSGVVRVVAAYDE